MTATVPLDAHAFVARAEQATNNNDTQWPLTVAYAPEILLEMIGDGVHQSHQGRDDVEPALKALYGWFAAAHGRITKTLVATSEDTIVNTWEGTLFDGRVTTRGAEIWRFDEHGRVVHNVLYNAVDAKPLTSPAAFKALVLHPRVALTYLAATLRERRRQSPPR